MRRSTGTVFVLALGVLNSIPATAANAKKTTSTPAVQATGAMAQPMTPTEIAATFGTGSPFSSSTPTGMTYTITLNSDGTASRMPRKGKVAIAGKWRVSKDGYCSAWGKGRENCYKIEKDGDRYKVLDARAGVVAYWKTK